MNLVAIKGGGGERLIAPYFAESMTFFIVFNDPFYIW